MTSAIRDTFRHVLIVEDDRRVREMLLDAVTDMGFEVESATTAEAALSALSRIPIDIAILDLQLPLMQGMDLFESLREKWPHVQVIVLTGVGNFEAARQAIRLDVTDFLTKPCPLGELEQAIQRARARRAAVAQLQGIPVSSASSMSAGTNRDLQPAGSVATAESPESLEDLERLHIFEALRRHNNNREQTAAALGISVRKLYYRLQQYDVQGQIPEDLKAHST